MKILLLGKNGQVGRELSEVLGPLGEVYAFDRAEADLEDLNGLKNIVTQYKPDIIVNAAAYTQVDKAESESEKAYLINATAVGVLAENAKQLGATFVHYSTDYVFDGSKKGFYFESDETCPISIYGKSKLSGEQAIIASGCKHIIFRTSWVYSPHGNNFIKTILRLVQEKDTLKVVNDQVGVPTSAKLIAEITAAVIQKISNKTVMENEIKGIYNLVPSGETTWYDLAKFVVKRSMDAGVRLKLHLNSLLPIASEDYPLPAKRPKNSRLNTEKIISTFGVEMPDWQEDVSETVDALIQTR
jgi:dTDP-4-dehydrorhamnose reductase